MFTFNRLDFAHQFMLVSFFILLIGMLVMGLWVGQQIRIGVINRTAAVTALYVDSFIAPHLQELSHTDQLSEDRLATLDMLLTDTPLGKRIVAFKIWRADGTILYSTNPALIGKRFPLGPNLASALAGEVRSHISDLSELENAYERQQWSHLIETYAPVRTEGTNSILAVSEFYQTTEELESEVRAAQFRSWLLVCVATLAMYLVLTGLVSRASNTIIAQQLELYDKVTQLTELLNQNHMLHERIKRAAARTASLNERFLRRIAADLHDGPAQDLALALLRIDELANVCATCMVSVAKRRSANEDFGTIQSALRTALADMRTILAGLRLPDISQLSIAEIAERAIRDYGHKSGAAVGLTISDVPVETPLSVKITLYRILQESLANGFRHAKGASQRVSITGNESQLIVEISDDGPGFDKQAVLADDHLGLVGMRERVEILGGTFELESAPANGTFIRARLPTTLLEVDNE